MPSPKEVKTEIIAAAVAQSVDVRTAIEIASIVESRLTAKPVDMPLTREERNARILAEWNGRNVRELMTKYHLGRSMIYQIVSKSE
jgi:Mor family transcriptional regulator